MEISIKTAELKAILNKLAYAKGVTNEQKSLLIGANNGNSECIICDPINQIEIKVILTADVMEEGYSLIPNNLFKIIQNINESEITVTKKDIVYGNNVITYKHYELCDFVRLDKDKRKNLLFSIPQKELYRLIKSTFYAVTQDEIRPTLTGLNISKNKVAGLDGYRLAISESEEFDTDASITLSAPTVKVLLKLLDKKSTDAVSFYITKKQDFVIIEIDKILVTAHLLDGAYIKYESIIPDDYKYEIQIDAKELLKKLKFMFKLTVSTQEIVKLTMDPSKLYIENSNSTSTIRDSIKINVVEHEELPFKIAFNPLYLRDALKKYKDIVTMQFSTRVSPAVIKSGNNLDLVLPVRILKE